MDLMETTHTERTATCHLGLHRGRQASSFPTHIMMWKNDTTYHFLITKRNNSNFQVRLWLSEKETLTGCCQFSRLKKSILFVKIG